MELAERVIILTRGFPKEELFVMVGQMRRAATSVPYNIAEGWGMDNRGSYVHSLRHADASLKELETQVILAARVGYATQSQADEILALADREGRMLRGLSRSQGAE